MLNFESSKPEYEVMVEKDVIIPMRDGIRLATDIYRPARNGKLVDGKFPTLLVRTPYGKSHSLMLLDNAPSYYAQRGYIVAIQDCRGYHNSEGVFYAFIHEGTDGYDTVEWLAAQPWSDGQVGTYGTSYLSWVQTALAVLNPPHLKAMIPNQGVWNAHTSSFRHQGTLELRWMCWTFFQAADSKAAHTNLQLASVLANVDVRDWLIRSPIKRFHSPLSLLHEFEQFYFDILTHGDYDEYWKRPCFAYDEFLDEHADIPIYCTGAWYDSYTRSTTEMYADLSKKKTKPVRLLMGSWTHGHMGIPYSGDVDFGPEALFDWNAFRLRWFDHWLKGMNTGLDKEPPVKIFVMGGGNGRKTPEGHLKHGGTWRFEKDWPLPRTKYTPFYLHGNMSLDTTPPTESKLSSSYQYDPKKPVPTIGGHLSSLDYLGPAPRPLGMFDIMSRKVPVVEAGGFDQREREGWFGCKPPYLPLATRHDILVFSTPPLKEDLEITGPITVNLWVGSSAPDTDFTAKLLDVYPPNQDYPKGYALNLTDGILRARYRNSRETPEFMTPKEIYDIRFPIYPTSNLFKAGHQIRLDISSSNWPRFDRNPNTGEPLGLHTRTIIAENTVYHDAEHPSHVVLPVIPFYE